MKKFSDIILIPHFYSVKWSRELNKLLSQYFIAPSGFIEDTYLPSRSVYHAYLSKVLPFIRKNKITKAFFVNLIEDFSPDFIKAGFIKEFYGIIHGSNFMATEPGRSIQLCDYEKAIAKITKKIFVSTKWFASQLPYKSIPIGLPILEPQMNPRDNDRILFSHRLVKEKNPLKLLELPKRIQERIIIGSPFVPFSNYTTKIKKNFKNVFLGATDEVYKRFLGECGFGLSLSDYDNFGYSVLEGIASGLCYFVPDNKTTAYNELIIDELRYKNIANLIEKIDFYTKNFTAKKKIVEKQQKSISKFYSDNWLKVLENHILQ